MIKFHIHARINYLFVIRVAVVFLDARNLKQTEKDAIDMIYF